MKMTHWILFFLICRSATVFGQEKASENVTPLPRAFSEHDCERARPLLDALDRGFCGVEADVWLVDGELLIARERVGVQPEKTLENLYLDPLKNRVEVNGGRVFSDGPPFTLLVNVHSEAEPTYEALKKSLQPHESMLTHFQNDKTETNAVTVVITGNRARELMEKDDARLAGYEGRINDLNNPVNPHFMPLIGDDWQYWFRWDGNALMNKQQRDRLKQAVEVAHYHKTRLRFWNAPDNPLGWIEFYQGGVDLISGSELDGLKDILQKAYQRQKNVEAFQKASAAMGQKNE